LAVRAVPTVGGSEGPALPYQGGLAGVGEKAADVAHDVRIPLAGIKYAIQVLMARRGDPVLGLDLARTTDLAAAVLVYMARDESVDVLPWFFMPEVLVPQKSKVDRVPYQTWIDEGLIIATPGAIIDYRAIQHTIETDIYPPYRFREIDYDPWNATGLATDLGPDGTGYVTVAIQQGIKTLNEPTKRFLALVAAAKLRHGGHPVLAWMASNLVTRSDPSGNLRPDKERSREKIDGITATINGIARLLALVKTKRRRRAPRVYTPGGFKELVDS